MHNDYIGAEFQAFPFIQIIRENAVYIRRFVYFKSFNTLLKFCFQFLMVYQVLGSCEIYLSKIGVLGTKFLPRTIF